MVKTVLFHYYPINLFSRLTFKIFMMYYLSLSYVTDDTEQFLNEQNHFPYRINDEKKIHISVFRFYFSF